MAKQRGKQQHVNKAHCKSKRNRLRYLKKGREREKGRETEWKDRNVFLLFCLLFLYDFYPVAFVVFTRRFLHDNGC